MCWVQLLHKLAAVYSYCDDVYIQRAVLVLARGLSYLSKLCHKCLHSYGKSQGNVLNFSRLVPCELIPSEEMCLPIFVWYWRLLCVYAHSSSRRMPAHLIICDSCGHISHGYTRYVSTVHDLCVITAYHSKMWWLPVPWLLLLLPQKCSSFMLVSWLCRRYITFLHCQVTLCYEANGLQCLMLWVWSQLYGQNHSCGFLFFLPYSWVQYFVVQATVPV